MWTSLIAALLGLASAGSPRAPLVVTAYDFAFRAPDSATSGVVTVRFVNRGKEDHQVVFLRLDDTATLARVTRTLVENKTHTTGVRAVGGVENARPGETNETTIILGPGRYVLLCDLPGADHRAHVQKGMLHTLTVAPSGNAADTTLPPAVATVRLTDYKIALSAPLRPGTRLVRVENDGAHRHHLIVARMVHGATMADVDKWDGESEPAPIVEIGGISALDPGVSGVTALRVTPGHYVLACVMNDGPGTKPHYMLGMETETVVR